MMSNTTIRVVNKQFEIIGESFRVKDIPAEGIIIVNKKKMYWYEFYQFKDQEQYMEWRKYLEGELKGDMKEADRIDLLYGLTYRYKKEGLLF